MNASGLLVVEQALVPKRRARAARGARVMTSVDGDGNVAACRKKVELHHHGVADRFHATGTAEFGSTAESGAFAAVAFVPLAAVAFGPLAAAVALVGLVASAWVSRPSPARVCILASQCAPNAPARCLGRPRRCRNGKQ